MMHFKDNHSMSIELAEKVGAAIADKSRLRILEEISKRGSLTCTEAQELTSLAQPTISHHIKTLIESGIVTAEKEGRHVRIALNKKVLSEFSLFFKKLA